MLRPAAGPTGETTGWLKLFQADRGAELLPSQNFIREGKQPKQNKNQEAFDQTVKLAFFLLFLGFFFVS